MYGVESLPVGKTWRWKSCPDFIKKSASLNKRRSMQSGRWRDISVLCAHPPFQIDGNFGFAAAVLEMLVQYEEQKIVFLPALPDEWKDGMAEGVKAPGNITLNFKWKEKRVTEINLKSPIDAKLVILYNGMEEEIVLNAGSSYQKTLI